MTAGVVNRALVAIGIAAVACCGLDASAGAQPQQGHTQQGKDQQKAQKRAQQDQAKAQKQQDQDRQQRQDLTRQHQQALMDRQAQRLDQYRQHLDQQQRVAQQQSTQLQRQHREAHYRYQQLYIADLSRQQLRIQSHGGYDYGRDLYLFEAPTYRYSRGGRSYDTNQFGVDLLRLRASRCVEAAARHGRDANRHERPIHDTCCHCTPPDHQRRPIGCGRLCC
jgi:hypothetical protein